MSLLSVQKNKKNRRTYGCHTGSLDTRWRGMSLRDGNIVPWSHMGRLERREDMLTLENLHERSCTVNKLCWRAQQIEGKLGLCGLNGTRVLDSNVQFRDEQHLIDGSSVSRAEKQPTTVLNVTQEDHLSVFRISVSRNVLPPTCKELLSSDETGLESLEFTLPVHYELSKTLA